jgi:hypothetical protein
MAQQLALEQVQPEVVVRENYCEPCQRQFKNKFALTMHHVTFHEKRGYIAKKNAGLLSKTHKGGTKLEKKLGRPLGSTSKKKNYCESCKKSFKGAHGLAIHNAQIHNAIKGKLKLKPNGGTVRASIQPQTHAAEEINLAFLAGAFCERLLLSERPELLTELVTSRLSASRVGSPQVR